jgi:hypothetical protein
MRSEFFRGAQSGRTPLGLRTRGLCIPAGTWLESGAGKLLDWENGALGEMYFAIRTITFSETFRRSGLWMLMLVLALTKAGCGGASSNPGGGNPPPAPNIVSMNPMSGAVGRPVTITGANFGMTQGTSTVKFNGVAATPTSWSSTSIAVTVPAGATNGNVVVTVGGVASNGVNFTVTAFVTGPSITGLSPMTGAAGTSVTIAGTNFGATQGPSTVTFNGIAATATSWGATSIVATVPAGAMTGSVVVTVGGVASNGVNFTVIASSMGPLKQSTVNTRYFVDPAGNGVFLAGSHTWDDFQDTDTNLGSTPAAFDFNGFVNFLVAHKQNATILWHKDLPEYCGWNSNTWRMTPWPWLRPGPGAATDGNAKFDLMQFNQAYFDRLRADVQQLQAKGIYAIVELFDANQLTSARCSTDGYPFTRTNNVNGVDDGYTSGSSGVSSVTMTGSNAITNIQDAYVKKVIDTLNDLPNVLWEVAEEQPGASMTWWAPHVMGVIRTYEAGKAFQHPVGIGSLNYNDRNDGTLYGSVADWVAPTINATVFPANVAVNNQGKVAINDSDHSLFWPAFTNADGSLQDQNLRGYLWENITQGAGGVVLMDPYEIFWPGSPNRNTCVSAVNQVCTGVDPKYDKFRTSMGIAQGYVNGKMDLVKATPQGSLSSTGYCLADNAATGAEYLVYAPNGGTFTVNLSATTRALNVEWFNPATGVTTAGGVITGGSPGQSFTAPPVGDFVLYIVDAAGHN